MSGLIVPEKDLHDRCCIAAISAIASRQEPPWFTDYYRRFGKDGVLENLSVRTGLNPNVLAMLALGLHFALSDNSPKGSKVADIKRKLKTQRSRLAKAREGLIALANEHRPENLKSTIPSTEHPDGSIEIDLNSLSDPYVNIINAIDCFLDKSKDLPHQGGGRSALHYYSVERLVRLVERDLTISELNSVCCELFHNILEKHENYWRRYARSEAPNFEDMIRRLLPNRRT
jgi:hypothetical protein